MISKNRALILLLLINLFNYIDRQVLAAVAPLIGGELHLTKDQLGWASTAFLVSYMILAPVFGWMADRGGRWLLIGAGVTLWSLASGGTGLASGFAALILTRCFVGVGEAAYGPAAPTLLSDLYPAERRGRVLSIFYLAIPVGSALGYMAGGALAKWWGWRGAFFALTPPGLLLGIAAMRMKEPPRGRVDHVKTRTARWKDYLALARNPSFVLDTAGLTAMSFAMQGVGFWMPYYISDLGTAGDLERINVILGAVVVLGGLLGTLAGGWLGDRLSKKWPGAYFLVCGGGLLLGAPVFWLMLRTPFPGAWILLFLGCFLLCVNTGPGNAILANVTHPSIRATAFAVNILIIHALGDAISPPLIGWIAKAHGWRIGFEFMAAIMAVGGVVWLWGAVYLERDMAAAGNSEF